MKDLPMLISFLLLAAVLLWQLWRSRLPWRWRLLWPVAISALLLMMLPLQWQRPQRELVVLTPGDQKNEAAARQWAVQTGAEVIAMPMQPDIAEVQALQTTWRDQGDVRLHLIGHGFSASVWQQLPAKTVMWQAPELPAWQLVATEHVALGDPVSIHLRAPASARLLQLVDRRGELLADTPVQAGQALLSFLPAATGHYDWQLRVRDTAGDLLREIPIAFTVSAVQSLMVAGQFAAPSFEQRALRDWFQQTGMRGEFVTRTGQSVMRRDQFNLDEQTRADSPALLIWDIRSWLAASVVDRQRLLKQIASGKTLVLLSDGSETEQAARTVLSKTLAINWRTLSEPDQKLMVADVELHRTNWLPQAQGDWRHSDVDEAVLLRSWQQGRIVWQGIADSHRLWQRARQHYASWWQRLLQLPTTAQPRWRSPGSGVQQQPSLLCIDELPAVAEGSNAAALQLQMPTGENLQLALQSTAWPGRACSLFTPTEVGWYELRAPVQASWRVYAAAPLPEQLAHEAQAATRRHTQALAPPAEITRQPLPHWPFFALSLFAFALIWWRERQLMSA